MRRYHLFEFNDQPWMPANLRDSGLNLLGLVLNTGNHYGSIVPELQRGLAATNTHRIVDLCSGGGGPWQSLTQALEAHGVDVEVVLTDLFPNVEAFKRLSESRKNVRFESSPLDATRMPTELAGFRTLFTSFHHFRPDEGCAILADAVRNRVGIGIFEFTYRLSWPVLIFSILPAAISTVLLCMIAIPFVRPFRWSTLFLTYIVPLFPLIAIWDGTVSCMRTYTTVEMLEMAKSVGGEDYEWKAGTKGVWASLMPVSYLVGVPRQ
jgi:hypothetical protein